MTCGSAVGPRSQGRIFMLHRTLVHRTGLGLTLAAAAMAAAACPRSWQPVR